MKGFHLRVAAPAGAVDFAARRSFYASALAARQLEAIGASSRLVLEGEAERFGAVLTFFPSPEDAAVFEERLTPLRSEIDAAMRSFGQFTRISDVRGSVLGAIRVGEAVGGAPALLALGRRDPIPPVPGQQTLFLARLRADDGVEVIVHVASAPPPGAWPEAEFFGRAVVVHVDRGDAMP